MENKIFNQSDAVCEKCYINLLSMAKKQGRLCLCMFDPKKKSHRFVFRLAIQVAISCNVPICSDLGFFKRLALYRQWHKIIHWIKKCDSTDNIPVDDLLEFMRPAVLEITEGDEFAYEHIYDLYYGEGDKK